MVVMRAIFAGWLIALMVWLLPGDRAREHNYHSDLFDWARGL